MFKRNRIILALSSLSLVGSIVAVPTVTFKSDATITDPIEISFARRTVTLSPFVAPAGSSVVVSGLTFNPAGQTEFFLNAVARKSNLASQPYSFTITPNSPSATITVSINPSLPANQQITFKSDLGKLSVRRQ